VNSSPGILHQGDSAATAPPADRVGEAELSLCRDADVLRGLCRTQWRRFQSKGETLVSNKKLKQLFDTNPAIIYFGVRFSGRPALSPPQNQIAITLNAGEHYE
jgi:hypothetical protein